jgi:hypothetical protein
MDHNCRGTNSKSSLQILSKIINKQGEQHPTLQQIMKPKTIITWGIIITMLWIVGQIQDQFCR